MIELKSTVIGEFKKQYPYLSDFDVKSLFDKAEGIYLDAAYPFDHSRISIPKNRPRAMRWILDCMTELLERGGCSSAVAYSENGLSFSFDGATVSERLLSRIKPTVGVVK